MLEKQTTFKTFDDLALFLVKAEKSRKEKPNLHRSVLRFLVPTSIVAAGKKFSAILLRTEKLISLEEMMLQLSWEACFRGIQTKDWFVLFELVMKFSTKEAFKTKIPWYIGVLYESSPRGGTWFSNHPALRKSEMLNRKFFNTDKKATSLLELISDNLSLSKPKSFINIVCEEISIQKPKATELNFIGVGYKDMGNLGDPGSLKPGDVPISEFDFLSLSLDSEKEQLFIVGLKEYLALKDKILKSMK